MKAVQDYQRWMADRDDKRRQEQADEMRREAEQGRQEERERLKAERKDDNAAKDRRYGEAIRRSIIPIGADPLDAVFLPARRYASAGNSDRNVSVRPSVRPSVCHAPVLCQNEES